MPHSDLSLGAHLLLWVFPLVLTTVVLVHHLVTGRVGRGDS